ncbi:hypothetical protein CspeluHIS016_0309360 [Cutaneotrichosporon spelunceum]|uniref:Uncharacterized protein n=1 Tax=Cutaneotrichosporon spelunceum TaxID=1672016 RepID=A0AAD3YBK4_9TREE|nr:hypothetical protein CspeluHIS016_0309360 [Cutaneotrichosporon spelunceum]
MSPARNLAMTHFDLGDPCDVSGPCTPSPFEIKSLAFGRPRVIPTSTSHGSVASDCSAGTETSASTAGSDDPQTPASALAGLALSSRDVTPLSSPIMSPPSAITGKRHRDQWTVDEVQLLENVLARPPPDLHFPPGSMPPPEVLDGLTSVLLETLDHKDMPMVSTAIDIDCSLIDTWPHSRDTTREKLAALALAETRLGAELANRKLTRQERLARPGIKRVGSMDYLDDEESTMPSERIGRVLRLSTTLQNSARGMMAERPNPLTNPASLPRTTSFVVPARIETGGLVRTSSSLSVSSAGSMSRRPSLLARGYSFTAEDLEAEDGDCIDFGRGRTSPRDELTPTTPLQADTPAVAVLSPSPPQEAAPKRISLGRSRSCGPSPREVQARRDSFLAPPIPGPRKVLGLDPSPGPSSSMVDGALGRAFECTARSRTPPGWESDSDRECARDCARECPRRRKLWGTLTMTALNAATRVRSSSVSSASRSGSGYVSSQSRSVSMSDGTSTPPLVLSSMVDEAARGGGTLLSPFMSPELA